MIKVITIGAGITRNTLTLLCGLDHWLASALKRYIMRKEIKMAYSPLPQGVLIQATRAVANVAQLSNQLKRKENWAANLFGRTVKRALLVLVIGGAAILFSGCLSVNVHKETDQPAPVVVVPNDHPNP
jgi:hypothetical protein